MGRSRLWAVGLVVALLLLSGLTIPAAPLSPGSSSSNTAAEPLRGGIRVTPGAAAPLPVGGRLFTTSTTAPDGDANSATGLAEDAGTVFAANEFAGTVTAFNESTGALLDAVTVADFAQGDYPAGVAIDPAHHRLFVSVSTEFAGIRTSGWVLLLNETGLTLLANLSFPATPHAPFEPTFLAYDPTGEQLFVENQTAGDLAIFNLTMANPTAAYLDCPVTNCAYRGYGLLDVPSYHTLVVPTCALQIWFVNTSNDSTRATVAGPAGSLMAWAAFDSATEALWVENYSFGATNGSFLRMNLTTLAIDANVPGAPPRGTQLVYDGGDGLLVGTDLSASEHISTYSAANASAVASYELGTGVGHPFLSLILDPSTHTALAAGPGNGTTVAFRLPSLQVALIYPSFAGRQPAVAVDPSTGTYLVAGENPNTVRAASESSGTVAWSTALPASSSPAALAVDPANGSVFVADGANSSILVLNTTTGAMTASIPIPGGWVACDALYDPAIGAVYVSSGIGAELLQIDPSTDAITQTLSIPGSYPCSLAIDPVTGDLLVASQSPGAVVEVAPSSFSILRTWSVAGSPGSLLVNESGVAFVLDANGSTITELNGSAGQTLGSFPIAGGLTAALVGDDPDGFLFALPSTLSELPVIASSSLRVAGTVPLSSVPQSIAFDPVTGTLVAPLGNGAVATAQLVPVPSAPTGLIATAGNGTFRLNWSAPSSSGPDPVDGYVVAIHPGPAASAGERTNVTTVGLSVTGVTDGVVYATQVFAHSSAGLGVVAASVSVVPIGVPFPPTDLRVNVTGPTSLAAQWSPPASVDGANVTDYWVYAFPAGGTSAVSVSAGASLSANLTGLQPATSYSVYVTALNAAGTGQPSATVLAATAAQPSAGFPWTYLGIGIAAAVVVGGGAMVWIIRRRARSERPPRDVP